MKRCPATAPHRLPTSKLSCRGGTSPLRFKRSRSAAGKDVPFVTSGSNSCKPQAQKIRPRGAEGTIQHSGSRTTGLPRYPIRRGCTNSLLNGDDSSRSRDDVHRWPTVDSIAGGCNAAWRQRVATGRTTARLAAWRVTCATRNMATAQNTLVSSYGVGRKQAEREVRAAPGARLCKPWIV